MSSASKQFRKIMAGGFLTGYVEAGTVGRPPLVLMHDGAFGTNADLCWSAVIDALGGEFHIFAPELLGWGATDKVVYLDRSPYAARIPHITAFLETLDIGPAAFMGVSFGGSMILRAAVEAGNPWQIARAIILSGTGGPYRQRASFEALAEFTPSVAAAAQLTDHLVMSSKGLEQHIQQRFANSLVPGHWEALMAPRLKNPSAAPRAETDDFLDKLKDLPVPICLVAGAHDHLLEPGWAERMAALSPAFKAITIDAAHEPNIDKPEIVVDLARQFLA